MRFAYLFIFLVNIELITFKHFHNNYFLVILIAPIIVGFFVEKNNWKKWLLIILVTIFIFLWCWFYPQNFTIKKLNQFLEQKTNFYYVKNKLINYINISIQNKNISNFANYLLFNHINESFQTFITTINNMGISHLFVISGMHINLIFQIWEKISKKWCPFWLTCTIRILLCIWFCYCLNFSNSTIRVLFQNILKCNKKINSYVNFGFSCFLHGFLLNNQILNYGFLFTYGCTFLSIIINNSKIKYQILKNYFVSLSCYFLTIPLVIKISHQINFSSVLFNIVLSPFIVIIFSLTILLLLIPYAYIVLYFPIYGFMFLVNFFNNLNVVIHIRSLPKFILVCYYFLIVMIFISIFLTNNKPKNRFFTYNEYIEINKKVKK